MDSQQKAQIDRAEEKLKTALDQYGANDSRSASFFQDCVEAYTRAGVSSQRVAWMRTKAHELSSSDGRQPPAILVRTYRGSESRAMEAYRRDSADLARNGYHPTSQVWAPGTWGCGAFLFAFLLCLILVGLIALIYMLIVKPDGVLTVTYQLQPMSTPQMALAPASIGEVKICPQCAEEVKLAAKICRFCSHAFEQLNADPRSP